MLVWLLQQVQSKQSSTAQTSSSSAPEPIDDGEERERNAQMLQRDSYIRGLGVVELVHRLLKSVHNNDPSLALAPTNSDPTGGGVIDRLSNNHVSLIMNE